MLMRAIIDYLKEYLYEVNKATLILISFITALLIYLNYSLYIDSNISNSDSFIANFGGRCLVHLIAFSIPYLVTALIQKRNYFSNPVFCFLLLTAPVIFSLKSSIHFSFIFSQHSETSTFWYYIMYWPSLVIIISLLLFIIWRLFHSDQLFYGLKTKGIDWKPYWMMLFIMLPLIIIASFQTDFLAAYPKMKLIANADQLKELSLWQMILFELSYGSDFITIELFFRGFLVLGFIKMVGKDAILPMAVFYCSIHFGKPLAECISSYFGGLILGVIVFNTRTILGGLLVHLGIAWLMEIGGFIGNQLIKTSS